MKYTTCMKCKKKKFCKKIIGYNPLGCTFTKHYICFKCKKES